MTASLGDVRRALGFFLLLMASHESETTADQLEYVMTFIETMDAGFFFRMVSGSTQEHMDDVFCDCQAHLYVFCYFASCPLAF